MKLTLFARSIILIIALLFVMGSITPASSEPEVRVFVEYRVGQQAGVQTALKNAGAAFHYQFDELNSFVVSLPESALNGIRRNPNVISIEEDPIRELVRNMPSEAAAMTAETILPEQVVPYGVDMVQARDIWDANRDGRIDKKAPTGAGRTVCIIDTGFYTEHEDFVGVDVLGGYSQTNGDDTFLWTLDGYGHGTHVAGTIVAQNNEYGVVGVTPGTASLYIVKIFGDDGLWVSKAHASDLIKAAFLCADNGANIISMSLSGTNKSGKEEQAFNNVYAQGILSVAAASNDGIEELHYPASYDSVISVAAIDSTYTVADFSQHNEKVELAAPGVNVLSTVPFISTASVTVDGVSYEALGMEFAPTGAASGELVDGGFCLATDPAADWTGKVVLCSRGSVSFAEKVTKVTQNGGEAAVIYNNKPGLFAGTLGEAGDYVIAVSISQEDGQYLVANKIGSVATVVSTFEFPASGYEAWAGTSMATPHVSAVAALIWSWNPSLTNVQIREAMVATAMDLGDPGRDDYYGYGLVQAYDALKYLGGGKPGKK
ncbi:MAG: peptidase S8 [Chloroflexi bacterium HGW-Chloroflexi-3]|nr:MAG: peptidase S8 [Chloroflexi bacterium HGW-Chloroflexi-3]